MNRFKFDLAFNDNTKANQLVWYILCRDLQIHIQVRELLKYLGEKVHASAFQLSGLVGKRAEGLHYRYGKCPESHSIPGQKDEEVGQG